MVDRSRLTAVTTGKIIYDYTYNPEKINQMSEQGISKEEILAQNKKAIGIIVTPGKRMYGVWMIYEYEVDGRTYIRCVEKSTHRKDLGIAIASKMRYVYEVRYDPMNPAVSVLGKTVGDSHDEKTDNSAVMSLIFGCLAMVTGMLVVPAIVFIVLSVINAIKAFKKEVYQPILPIMGLCLSAFSLISIFVSIVSFAAFILAFIAEYF